MVGFSPVSFGVYLTFRPLALRQSRLYMCCNVFFFSGCQPSLLLMNLGSKFFFTSLLVW